MNIFFMALAVFTVLRLAKLALEAPSWVWQLLAVGLSALVLIPGITDEPWWTFLAIAGIVSFLHLLEDFLIAKADEALIAINTRRR